jgi:hypothetical protein
MRVGEGLAKVRAMSLAEIAWRVRDRAYREWDRRTARIQGEPEERLRGAVSATTRGASDWKLALLAARQGTASVLFPSLLNLVQTADCLRSRFPDGVARSVRQADGALQGRVHFFGKDWSVGDSVDWHRAPGRSASWPLLHHTDIPIVGGDANLGDVKEVWELNRHHVLIDLAKAWLLTGDARYSDHIARLVDSWIDANPPGFGVNWAGPLEVAYRALAWSWAYGITFGELPDDVHVRWLASLGDHGAFLHRHLEIYSSPYNHLVGQAAVLYLLGLSLPEHSEAGQWRLRGRRVLEARLAIQFYADGGSVEQATCYHHATLGFYLLAALAGRQAGDPFSGAVWVALERALEFSGQLAQPDGRLPAIGDNDDAWPVCFDRIDGWDFRHYLAVGAVLFRKPELKHRAGALREEVLWLLGADACDEYDALPSKLPQQPSVFLSHSGYLVLRSDGGPAADYLLFDCGEQAGGLRHDGVSSAAHGHADALSVVLYLSGESVLVDAGFFTYNGERNWERFFRETAAHNTLRLDGRDQATHLEKMAWSFVPRVTVHATGDISSGNAPAVRWGEASHDGYARGQQPVVHRRTVWLRDGYAVIADALDGVGVHDIEVTFQLSPGRTVVVEGRHLKAMPFELHWVASTEVDAAVDIGGGGPDGGWVAHALHTCTAAARLVLSSRSEAAHWRLLTVIIDRRRWAVTTDEQTAPEGAPVDVHLRSCHNSVVERVAWSSDLGSPHPAIRIDRKP